MVYSAQEHRSWNAAHQGGSSRSRRRGSFPNHGRLVAEAAVLNYPSDRSSRSSWYIAVIRAVTGTSPLLEREGMRCILSVGPFVGDVGQVPRVEVTGHSEEEGLALLCKRLGALARRRMGALTLDELFAQ